MKKILRRYFLQYKCSNGKFGNLDDYHFGWKNSGDSNNLGDMRILKKYHEAFEEDCCKKDITKNKAIFRIIERIENEVEDNDDI